MSSSLNQKSVQVVAGVAVVMALLGGAYAVGRSQGGERMTAMPEPVETQQVASAQAPRDAGRNLAQAAARDAQDVQEVRQAPAPSRPAPVVTRDVQADLCASCARVTSVHTETRRGQSSGVGAVGVAVVGGLLGNMVGGGTGRKLATVGGAVAGGYAGNEIEKNQKSHTVWVIQMREADGRLRRFERSADPGLRVGDEVLLTEQGFTRR